MERPLLITLFLLIALHSSPTLANLSPDQARKLIARVAGARLSGKAVRVRSVSGTDQEAEATAEIETAFRAVQDKNGNWQLIEVRTGQDQWEEISFIATAAGAELPEKACNDPDLGRQGGGVLSVKRARCLIASVLKIEFPSDAVRVRSVSDLGLPFASSPSAIIVALVQADVRFRKDRGKWQISHMRAGRGAWIDVDSVVSGLTEEKRKRAQSDLAILASALERFRKDSGFYVASDKEPVLVDHLSPGYLYPIIRLDPWGQPYRYQGDRDHFLLRSYGPDMKENTPDDIVVSSQSRPS